MQTQLEKSKRNHITASAAFSKRTTACEAVRSPVAGDPGVDGWFRSKCAIIKGLYGTLCI